MSHFLLIFTKLVKLKGAQIREGGQYLLAVSKSPGAINNEAQIFPKTKNRLRTIEAWLQVQM